MPISGGIFLAKIKVNGEWLLEDFNIKQGVAQAFHNLLFDMGEW